MQRSTHPVADLTEVGRGDVAAVGGKAAALGELVAAGFPVPAGFVVGTGAFLAALDAAGLRDEVDAVLRSWVSGDGSGSTEEVADAIRAIAVPAPVEDAIRVFHRELVASTGDRDDDGVSVAVRSSGTDEDAAASSFAGMHASYLDVVGVDDVLGRIRDCWASSVSARAIAYRSVRAPGSAPSMAVIVQRMVEAVSSGVLLGVDPSGADPDRLVIEASTTAGAVVGGLVDPDRYVVDVPRRVVVSARRGRRPLTDRERVLAEDRVLELAALGRRIQDRFGAPQDVEWVIGADGAIGIVQARPITASAGSRTVTEVAVPTGIGSLPAPDPLVVGIGASPGVATGPIRVLLDPVDAVELLDGEVLVAPETRPDWMPAMQRAAAIVTDTGGMASHAAIVARELGLPCVVGTGTATTDLVDGDLVTVDGVLGSVVRAEDDRR